MPAEELRTFRPRKCRGVGPVVGGTGVGKGVRRAGVGMKLVRLVEAVQLRVELAHVLGYGTLITSAEYYNG